MPKINIVADFVQICLICPHVCTFTKSIANSSRKRVQICECHRVGDKVKQRVIKHVGISNNDSHLEELKKLAETMKAKIKQEREDPSLFDLPIPV